MYKVGDKVLLKGIIEKPIDMDGEYKVFLPGCSCDKYTYAKPGVIFGKVEEFERIKQPLRVGDVLKKADLSCVIFKEVPYGFNLIFSDGSSGFRTVEAIDEGFERTGINLGDNVEAILSALSKVKGA